jgi:hypothetical protein
MKSYGRPSGGVLGTLLDLRVEGERQAERVLAAAAAARRTAEVQAARLVAEVAAAQAAVAAARLDAGQRPGGAERVAEAQERRRYWARLERTAAAAVEVHARYRAGDLARAIDADAAARAAHLRARQRREVVEKAIARREAAARRDADRRAEAAADDLARGRANVPRPSR